MSESTGKEKSKKIIRLEEVMERTGLSRSTIYNLMDPKCRQYDPTFPNRVSLTVRAVGWVEHEVDTWLDAKIQKRCPDNRSTMTA